MTSLVGSNRQKMSRHFLTLFTIRALIFYRGMISQRRFIVFRFYLMINLDQRKILNFTQLVISSFTIIRLFKPLYRPFHRS